jgi:hypothetical protein
MAAKEDSMKLNQAIDCVCSYLARRDMSEPSAGELVRLTGRPCADALFAFGCDLTEIPELAAQIFHQKLCNILLFSGGVGHATDNLRKNAHEKYGMDCENSAEAEIMAEIAVRFLHVPKEKVYIEKDSTNSGENAEFSIGLLRRNNIPLKSVLLLQDPMMQQRSHLATLKHLDPGSMLISYAPFIPRAEGTRPWPDERFFELVLREIPRITDDENGYGPNGRNFIVHADIPPEVAKSYRYIQTVIHI